MTHIENLRQTADTMDHIADLASAGDLGQFEHLVCIGGGCNEIGHELRAAADEMGRLAAEVERLRMVERKALALSNGLEKALEQGISALISTVNEALTKAAEVQADA